MFYMLENIKKAVDAIENALTLKSNYNEEVEKLNTLKSDLAVLHYQGINVDDVNTKINHILNWIEAEK